MNRRIVLAAASALAVAAPFAASTAASAASPAATSHRVVPVCAQAATGYAACMSKVAYNVDKNGKVVPNATPSGYGPADLRAAYNLGSSTSGGRTVAIVDAYDAPTAEADLGVYRSTFGLSACTTANGCFKKVNQTGGTSYPKANGGWAQEISLDIDMVSAICPDCHILLVEASSNSFANLAAAVNYAASVPGVIAISNSYGGSDSSNNSAYENAAAKGIAVVASSGDAGYGVESPASNTHVVGVGGTHLVRSSTARGWTETVWSGAGSGCSTLNANPGWQTGTQCAKKAVSDVSAVADPNTGVAVYDSTAYQGLKGWMVFGGTSVASPIIGSVYALGHNFGTYAGQYSWAHASSLNDVTSGSNGSCSPSLWCTGTTGWDGPTGLGTPNGIGAF